jgi:signal transduction histidine kinase
LTSITAYVEILRESDPALVVEDLPGILDVLSRNSAALRNIVDQLLDLAALDGRHNGLAHEPVDLAAAVRAAAEGVRPVAEAARVEVDLDLRARAVVTGDAERLRQVVEELLHNAIRHIVGAGRVTVLLTRPDPAAVELTVTDTGVGVPAAERDRLFARFYRSQRTREHRIPGNGLGLALSRAIVERHRGSIRLLPGSGPGTRITVRLPVES